VQYRWPKATLLRRARMPMLARLILLRAIRDRKRILLKEPPSFRWIRRWATSFVPTCSSRQDNRVRRPGPELRCARRQHDRRRRERNHLDPWDDRCHRHAWEGQIRGVIPNSATIGCGTSVSRLFARRLGSVDGVHQRQTACGDRRRGRVEERKLFAHGGNAFRQRLDLARGGILSRRPAGDFFGNGRKT
jgi:hypothetical protein